MIESGSFCTPTTTIQAQTGDDSLPEDQGSTDTPLDTGADEPMTEGDKKAMEESSSPR